MKTEYTAEKHQYKIRYRCPNGKHCTCCDPRSGKGRRIENRRVKHRLKHESRKKINFEIYDILSLE